MTKQICINLYAGSCAGKSTVSAYIFSQLKKEHLNCEFVGEFAKDLSYSKRYLELENQFFVSASQYNKMFILNNVDILICDSPILIALIYTKEDEYNDLQKILLSKYNKYENINIFINRGSNFSQVGRHTNLEESIAADNKIKQILENNNIDYHNYYHENDNIMEFIKTKLELYNE